MDPNTQRAEAERWLGIAAKLLTARDFLGSKTFAIRAREADPNNAVSDQILAVVDTVLAGEKRVDTTQQPDWYGVLQLPRLVRDPDFIANHYRRLVLLLNPEHNRLPFADYALQLAMDAWSVLSDPTKKWLFDNELALSLQRAASEPQRVDPVHPNPVRVDPGVVAASSQVNTFQFFQPQPQVQPQVQHHQPQSQPSQQPQPQQQQPTLQMWQQQPQPQPQPQPQHQVDFMPVPPQQQLPAGPVQQLLPQWQMRDPTPVKGGGGGGGGGGGNGGERNKGSVNGSARTTTSAPAPVPAPTSPPPIARAPAPTPQATRPRAMPPPAPVAPPPASVPVPPAPTPVPIPVPVVSPVAPVPAAQPREKLTEVRTAVVDDGNVVGSAHKNNKSSNNNNQNSAGIGNSVADGGANENNDEGGVEEDVESFWTACPYCFYIYEYQKMYQDCTLRCQNCRRAFHAVQIPNPPPVASPANGGKEKETSFCCWGFFPLGFSMAAWKKHNQMGNQNRSSNWVPFSPMFACPAENGDGNFQWFASDKGNASVGPNYVAKNGPAPRVYIDDVEDLVDVSDPSDSDSSDGDWRNPNRNKTKKKQKKGRIVRSRRGRPRKADTSNQGNQNSVGGDGVFGGGEDLRDGSSTQQVVFGLVAGKKADASKKVASTVMRKHSRRSVKDMGRLDLNVEFNNEGDEHAPTASAVNGEEDGMENIGFFEGLDEFLSTLPMLNVNGDEKAKPS